MYLTTADVISCEDGALRLVNGDQTEGRVEICFDDMWGTVCDDFWDINNARVACRQLGFRDAIQATRFASFGPGIGPIHLDNVMCIGKCLQHSYVTGFGKPTIYTQGKIITSILPTL